MYIQRVNRRLLFAICDSLSFFSHDFECRVQNIANNELSRVHLKQIIAFTAYQVEQFSINACSRACITSSTYSVFLYLHLST